MTTTPNESKRAPDKGLTPLALGTKLGRLVRRRASEAQLGRRLKPVGRSIDRFVTLMVVAIVITYGMRLLWFVLTR